MTKNNRSIIIGIDGVPYRLIEEFTSEGIMPNTKRIIDNGTFKKMKSTIPAISSVSWSTIFTGENPGKHGVFGFTDLVPNTYTVSFPNYKSLQADPFWADRDGGYHIVINVPFTYPAPELNGKLVSGFVAPELSKAVYPDDLATKLEEMDYKIDVDSTKAHKSKDLFLEKLFEVLEKRKKAYRELWEDDWDTFFFVITGTDRLMHFLWNAFEADNHEYRDEFEEFFRQVDEVIGEINSRAKESDRLTIVSDHGFGPSKYSFNVNAALKNNGFLQLEDEPSKKNYNSLGKETKAFALDPGRVYLNLEDKFPSGSVKVRESDEIIRDLRQTFTDITHEGNKVIEEVYQGEEIYEGPHAQNGPDLILQGAKNYNLGAKMDELSKDEEKDQVIKEDKFTGKHTYPDAIFIQNRKSENLPAKSISAQDVLDLSLVNSEEEEIAERLESLGYI